ncbi:MAG: hypothetical protein IH820_11025, partial [Bacteroidetes bacterium]|nr:hypothetical protein [Bacteroidota bacterium]
AGRWRLDVQVDNPDGVDQVQIEVEVMDRSPVPALAGPALLRSSRIITALLIVPAMAVGYAFDSVLYLFLIADLVCAGAMVPVFLGGLLRMFTEKRATSKEEKEQRRERGVLFGSGLVGGEGLFGVCIAGYAAYTASSPEGIGYEWAGSFAPLAAAVVFLALIAYFWRLTRRA